MNTPEEAREYLTNIVHKLQFDEALELQKAIDLICDYPTPASNIIFGVLTNGEIFVEVNGQQHTPADGFYKMATIQSTKLAHQVRDLEIALMESRRTSKRLTDQLELNTTILDKIVDLSSEISDGL